MAAPPAKAHLDALQRLITADAVANSHFKAILNEKDPPPGTLEGLVALQAEGHGPKTELGDHQAALAEFHGFHGAMKVRRRSSTIPEATCRGTLGVTNTGCVIPAGALLRGDPGSSALQRQVVVPARASTINLWLWLLGPGYVGFAAIPG